MSGWFQRTVSIKARKRGCHLITDEIVKQVPEIKYAACRSHVVVTA